MAGVLVALFLGMFGAVGCGSSGEDGRPAHVGLADLSDRQEEFTGATVETFGIIRRFDDTGGTYYVIEDDDHNRVRVEPAEDFAGLVGDQVVVIGQFDYDETRGRQLTATQVLPPT